VYYQYLVLIRHQFTDKVFGLLAKRKQTNDNAKVMIKENIVGSGIMVL